MLHKMKLNESPFERIKNGKKTIEFRLYDEKRQQIKIGDKIEFSKLPDLQEKLLVDVVELYRENTFENLFRKLYTDEDEINRKTISMHQYYSSEKEKEYGVLGIKIKINVDNLKQFDDRKIVELIKNGKVAVADIVDSGICPTCFDKQNNHILYGDNTDRMIFEDDNFECFLVGNPRADGHTVISTKKHYKDMMEIDDEMCNEIFLLAKKVMNILKEVYNAESIYLCTMCDGPMNHFHIQLIPRYSFEKRGSKNFVKPRFEYKENKEKITQLRNRMNF